MNFSLFLGIIIMVYGDNKGHRYEKTIASILKSKGVKLIKEPAGSTDDSDLEFIHNGKIFRLEMKNNAVGPDWGQVSFRFDNGKWNWSSSKKRDNIIRIYDKLEIAGSVGVLNYLNTNIRPNMGRIKKIGKEEHDEDFKLLDKWFNIESNAIEKFYENADYLQVGNGFGFYHIREDIAKLDTEKIVAQFKLRLRTKSIHNHHNRCPICKGAYKGSYKKCKKCEKILSVENPKKCEECGEEVEYSDFIHVYDNYGFFAVLKCERIFKKSEFNIESVLGQRFPNITS